jgi:predicted Ser/Thr protein kinase
MLKVIHDVTIDEVTERQMNAKELAQFELDKEAKAIKTAQEITEVAEKAALLEKLGITEDEARMLLV